MKDIIVNSNITISQAMKRLDKTAEKSLVVVDGYDKLLGSLTDGDLRRGILSGMNFSGCYYKDDFTFRQGNYAQEDAT